MSIADRNGKIWKDGSMVEWRNATVHVLTHSLHYGMAVFEGVRAYRTAQGTAIFRLEDHTRRLLNSARIFQMEVPFDLATLAQAQIQVVQENGMDACYLRPLVWIGSGRMGISFHDHPIHVAVAAWQSQPYLHGVADGLRVKTSSFARHHVNVSMVRAKASGHYVNSILAHQEARADGYDEALILDTDGYVCEGAGANIFIVKNGKLYTPDLGSCLEGITRDDIYCCDEAFFTGTAAEVMPIREFDNRRLGEGKPGPLTERLRSLFVSATRGTSPRYQHWLTHV